MQQDYPTAWHRRLVVATKPSRKLNRTRSVSLLKNINRADEVMQTIARRESTESLEGIDITAAVPVNLAKPPATRRGKKVAERLVLHGVEKGLMGESSLLDILEGQSEMKKEDDDALVPEGQIFPENACGSCNIKEATHGCRACGFIFCLNCAMHTHKMGSFKHHELFSLDDPEHEDWVNAFMRNDVAIDAMARLNAIAFRKRREREEEKKKASARPKSKKWKPKNTRKGIKFSDL